MLHSRHLQDNSVGRGAAGWESTVRSSDRLFTWTTMRSPFNPEVTSSDDRVADLDIKTLVTDQLAHIP